MTKLSEIDEALCESSEWDFSDLSALYINCTLKRSPEVSNTQGLADRSIAIMERNGVSVEVDARGRPRHRDRGRARHDRVRLGARRLAGDRTRR